MSGITYEKDPEKIREVYADRDYWRSLIKDDEWELLGFTYRNSASFVRKGGGGAIEVTRSHLKLLGIEPVTTKGN